MVNSFDTAVEKVLKAEGGYTNDPRDRGNWTTGVVGEGECKGTKYGISAMSYPHLDIVNLTLNQAKDIYRKDYWDAIGLDSLHPILAAQVFDAAVQHGSATAVKLLQRVIGLNADGKLNTATIKTLEYMDQKLLTFQYIAKRLEYYASIKTFSVYGKGWVNRMVANITDVVQACSEVAP